MEKRTNYDVSMAFMGFCDFGLDLHDYSIIVNLPQSSRTKSRKGKIKLEWINKNNKQNKRK